MDLFELAKNFGLPTALMIIAIVWLVRLLRDILKGELIVPRYVYDAKVAENEALTARLDRATALAEHATNDVARPALKRAAHRDD